MSRYCNVKLLTINHYVGYKLRYIKINKLNIYSGFIKYIIIKKYTCIFFYNYIFNKTKCQYKIVNYYINIALHCNISVMIYYMLIFQGNKYYMYKHIVHKDNCIV